MHLFHVLPLLTATAAFGQFVPPIGPSTDAAHPAPTARKPGPEILSNEDLILRLPPARQERVHDTSTDRWVTDPFSREWENRIVAGRVSAPELDAAIRRCGLLRSSPTYHEGEPYHVWLRMPSWLPGQVATARPGNPGMVEATAAEIDLDRGGCGNAIAEQESSESFQNVGVLPKGPEAATFILEITPSKYWSGAKITWSGQITLPVEVVPKGPPAPIDSPELTALVRRTANVSCSNGFFSNSPSIWLSAWTQRPPTGPLSSTLMCLKAELLRNGEVVSTQFFADPDEVDAEERLGQAAFVHGDDARAVILRKDLEKYQVRISGIAPTVPSRWYRTRYWSGEYSVPLSEILEPECGMRPAGMCGPDGT